MEPLVEHSMQLAGHRTRVLELEGAGPGIVLLHGWGDSADTWRPLLAELAASGRRAIAVDLPGFGKATRLAPGAILPQLDDFAASLVLEWGGGEPVVVAGNSLGGAVALRLGERADLPLAGVVPVAPAGLEMPGWFDLVERDPIVRRLLDIPMPVPGALIRALVGNAYKQLAFSQPARGRSARSSRRSPATTARAPTPPRCSSPGAGCCPSWPSRRSTSPPSPARCCSCGARATAWSRTAARAWCSTRCRTRASS